VRSLAVGMLQAGVQAVIASLWPAHDRATYLLIVRFAQEWFPNRHSESPAAALARAQYWLRHVTQEELVHWQASEPHASILADMPDPRPEEQCDASPVEVRDLTAVRGNDGYSLAEEDQLSDNDLLTRSGHSTIKKEQDSNLATLRAKKDSHTRPYAHPFYWAGFQVTGW
jgi:CHAT domain-containing protein